MKLSFVKTLCIAAAAVVLFTSSAMAQTKIRLATVAPRDTTFHKTILDMGNQWKKDSNGAVILTVYPDGQMGSETDMVRRQ